MSKTAEQESKGTESKVQLGWLRRSVAPNIRSKIVLPYLILTLIVAIVGLYVVTNLVASSLDERLTNQLLEAGRVVSDSVARQEMEHLKIARTIGSTTGLAEALQSGDQDQVFGLAQPTVSVRKLENLIIVDTEGQTMLHSLQQDDGSFQFVGDEFDASQLWMVQRLLETNDPNSMPKRGIVLNTVDQRYYYLTAVPIGLEGETVGVIVVGTSLRSLLFQIKNSALADVVIHLDGGKAIAATFVAEQAEDAQSLMDELSITPAQYEAVLSDPEMVTGENERVRGRWYRLARAPLRVADDTLGVFTVALPSSFIVQTGTTSRNTYTLVFTSAMMVVVLLGYFIAQRITGPIQRLVQTSQAVAEGDLNKRTGIASEDEIGVLATTFDEMTVRLSKRTRDLEEALGRLRAILSSIGDGVVLEDLDGNFIPLNATAENILEDLTDQFMLGSLHDFSTGGQPQTQATSNPWLLDRRRFEVGEKVINAHSASVQTEDGDQLGVVIVLRDVTAQVEAERLKDAFITQISHELRTPLTAIKGYSDLLVISASDALNGDQLNFLRTISRHTENLASMINTLLDFSEMEAGGELGLRQHPTQLLSIVDDIADKWRDRMEEENLALEVKKPPDLPLVNADAKRLQWAFINLVRNAVEYTPAGGQVTLRLFKHDGYVQFDVSDTGVGIPEEEQKYLFDRFYRVDQARKDESRGLGLGLYVTKAIVEAHGGKISVDSVEGAGSTFSVQLPQMPNDE